MRKTALFMAGLVTLAGLPTALLGKSSEIPERREFPVNQSINACQDFYQHACSQVIDSFQLRDDRSYHAFSFSDSAERLLEKKKAFMATIGAQKGLSSRGQQMQQVYGACMNEPARTKAEKEFVKSTLAAVGAAKSRDDFLKLVSTKLGKGEYAFVDFGTYPNQKDSNWNDIYLDVTLQNLPERSYYDNAEMLKDYESLIAAFFKTIGHGEAEKLAKAIVAIEKDFAAVYPLPAEIREIVNTPTEAKRADLLQRYPKFLLQDFLARLPERTLIRDLMPKAFDKAHEILSTSDLETLKGFYLFREMSSHLQDAYPKYFDERFAFNRKHLGGPDKLPAREERCTKYVMSNFDKELDFEMVDRVFPNFPQEKFVGLAEKVRASIIAGIESNPWLSKEGKAGATQKMRSADLMLVKPQNDKEWNFRPQATYSTTDPIFNDKLLERMTEEKKIVELAEKRDKRRWLMGPLTVNAYYVPSSNQFVMPIGILQYPFYDPKLPDHVNLGAVGAVIGHELGHGIDDQGARYDSAGNLKQWMSDGDLAAFKERGAKLVAQFDAIGHNGTLTLGENIGDLVGLSFAYRAAFPEGKGDTAKKQEFFLQYARVWCQVMRPKLAERFLKTGPHSLGLARVNEQVKHQPGFAEAFQCKAGDPMVLGNDDRVTIW